MKSLESIYKRIWELKNKALTVESKLEIQKLQQQLETNSDTPNKNNSAKNNSSNSEEEYLDKFLFNRYNR